MTKEGYTHIIVPKPLHETLKQMAQAHNLSIAKLLEKLLANISINTGVNTIQKNPLNPAIESQNSSLLQQNNHYPSSFYQKKQKLGVVGDEVPYMAGPVGFEPTTYNLGGCRAILAAPRAHFAHQFLGLFLFNIGFTFIFNWTLVTFVFSTIIFSNFC